MINKYLQSSIEKILNWDRQSYHQLARNMTNREIWAMRQKLIDNSYPIEEYTPNQIDFKEQIVYHYILFLLFEAEYGNYIDADTHKLYDILFYL